MSKIKTTVIVCLTVLLVGQALHVSYAGRKLYSDRSDVRAYIKELVNKHHFNRAELLGLFKKAKRQDAVLEAIARPAERELSWHEYRPIFVSDKRINGAVDFWSENHAVLAKAEEQFGVPAEMVVAILGVESFFGKHTGKHPVLDTLITLSFDYDRRQEFWRRELEEYLLLMKEQQVDPFSIKGSYAGAMGWGQFISSSYRAYAVDFDGDDKRDLWENHVDAIGSVANYFKQHGWQQGEPVAKQVELSGDVQALSDIIVSRGRKGLKPELTVRELIGKGVKPDKALPLDAMAVLIKLEGKDGDEYWLGFKNFYVITRYNQSAMYAMAAYQLSQEVEQAYNRRLAGQSAVN